jgi:hypothetical protein
MANYQHQNRENLLTNHYRNLDAANPIRFTMPSCKTPSYYARQTIGRGMHFVDPDLLEVWHVN